MACLKPKKHEKQPRGLKLLQREVLRHAIEDGSDLAMLCTARINEEEHGMQFLAPFFRDVRRFSSRRIQKRGSSCFALLAATLALAGATATAMPAYAAGGFDYEILQPDDNCLIQLEAEDPPLQDMCFGTAASGSGFQSCLSAGGNVAIGPAGIVCWNSGAARPTNATRQKYADEDFPAMGACLKKGKSVTFKSKKVGCVGTPAEILRVVGVK